ncbi:MAG: hypothetical protein PHE50_00450 [Dehalococcoidales bacterium]|nr:hypothetical protein [Dehalococcoidales bacterium]
MKNISKIFRGEESGQVLLVVLAVLLLGSLSITPVLSFASTSIAANNRLEIQTKGIYAAEAGVEKVRWSLENNAQPPVSLANDINDMGVGMETVFLGNYTLYFGTLVPTNGHSNFLRVQGDMVWNGGVNAYLYTITVTKQNTPSTVFINQVGVRLPPGYHYVAYSANDFPTNVARGEPEISQDSLGAEMMNWTFSNTKVDPTKTEKFYVTGEGELEGDYTWVVANRSDIGEVGEITGGVYDVTSTATNDTDNVTAIIQTKLMMVGGQAEVISWQITK